MEREDTTKNLISKEKILLLHSKTNKFMKKVLFASLFMAFLAVSCKKSSTVTPIGSSSFMSFTAGSSWNYKTTDSTGETPYTLTSTNIDSTINGRSYHIFTYQDANGSNSEYYSNSGSEYYQFTQLAAQLDPFEIKYLVDNVNTGTSWTQPFATTQVIQTYTVALNATIKNTITEKGNSITVNGTTFNNVIKVTTEITNPSVTSNIPLVTLTVQPITQNIVAYYAPKYGLVKRIFQLKVDVASSLPIVPTTNVVNNNSTTELISSNIP